MAVFQMVVTVASGHILSPFTCSEIPISNELNASVIDSQVNINSSKVHQIKQIEFVYTSLKDKFVQRAAKQMRP